MKVMRSRLFCIAVVCFAVSTRLGVAGQVTVTNFSFETPTAPVSFTAVSDPGTNAGFIPGWRFDLNVAGGTVTCSVAGNPPPNSTGQQVLNMQMDVPSSLPASGSAYATASNVLTIASNATYTLTFTAAMASFHGAGADASLLAGSSVACTASVPFSSLLPMTDYSTSFTTAPSGDPLVGQPLSIQLHMGGGYQSEGSVNFDNIRLSVTQAGPVLKLVQPTPGQTQFTWPTNFTGYNLESAANLTGAAWNPVTNSVAETNGQFWVNFSPAPGQNYFRLHQ